MSALRRYQIRAYAGTFGFYGELVPIAEVERHAKAQMRDFDKSNRCLVPTANPKRLTATTNRLILSL
jgi:hypothetical protein